MKSPPSEAVERFHHDLDQVARPAFDRRALTENDVLALAISGGPDSMAMLVLANAAFPDRVAAATFDHSLRAGSADEARLVNQVCAELGVPHSVLTASEAIVGSSIQGQARQARYGALTAWARVQNMYPLLTAHHADDQAETLLMRLNRSSGISGLSGIRPARVDNEVLILRPLLDWRRDDLRTIVEDCGIPFVIDPTNSDDRHDRTRIRKLLAERPELDAAALAASAAILGDAEEALGHFARLHWSLLWHGPDRGLAFDNLPREIRRRLIRWAILDVRASRAVASPAFSEASNVEPLLDALEAGRGAVQGGIQVRPSATGWTFQPAPPRKDH
jgi:tRNA(Ile)-lysidine synthase